MGPGYLRARVPFALLGVAGGPSPRLTAVKRVGFLGPRGTFADEALATQPDLAGMEQVPYPTVPQVINAVEAMNGIDVGLVPLENSIEGTVTVTLDTLAFDTDLLIQRELTCRSRFRSALRRGPNSGGAHDRVAPQPARAVSSVALTEIA